MLLQYSTLRPFSNVGSAIRNHVASLLKKLVLFCVMSDVQNGLIMVTAFLLKTIIVLDPVFEQLINNHECDGGSDTDRRLFTSTADVAKTISIWLIVPKKRISTMARCRGYWSPVIPCDIR